MPFELTAPNLLWTLGLLAPLIVLYILKVKRKRLKIASTWLWQQAQRDLMARSPFKRLIFQIPLLLQALALILLALAAAGPATRGKTVSGDHVAIVVDTSASMATQDPAAGKPRIALAKEAALEVVNALPPGTDAMILDAGRDTRVALPPDRDTRRMKSVIGDLAAREVEGDLASAVSLAVSRLQQQGGLRRVIVITDGNLARPAPLSSSVVPIELIRVGGPVANTAIVRVDVRAGEDPVDHREQVQAFLMVANFGDQPREIYVTMRQRNASDVLASRKVVVAAKSKLPVVLTFHPTEGDYGTGLIFDTAPHDALPVDDVAYGRVPAGRKLPVFAAAAEGEPSAWILRALVADPDSEVRQGSIADLATAKIPNGSLLVLEGACPPNPPGGDVLFVNPPAGNCFGTIVGKKVEQPVITSWEHGDPRLRFLGFEGVLVGEARLLQPESKRQALIRTDQGAIATDVSTSARSATLLGFDPAESNWPRFPSFVVFIRNVMDQARHHRSSGISGPALAGDPLRASIPPDVREVTVEAPGGGDPLVVPVRDGLAVVPDVQKVGLYHLSWEEPAAGSMWIPVNLVSSAESDLTREPSDLLGATVAVTPATEIVEARDDWGWILAIVALAFICFDVWWYTRAPQRARPAPTKPKARDEQEAAA